MAPIGLNGRKRQLRKGDREGFRKLANWYWNGVGCEKDDHKALEMCKKAAELGHRNSMELYGCNAFKEDEWERYMWWGRVGGGGAALRLINATKQQLKLFFKGGSGRIVFEIGAACKGHVNGSTVFGLTHALRAAEVAQAITLHDEWCATAKQAIFIWTWLTSQNNVPKDIRNIVSKMLWANRAAWSERVRF
jgi:TPR repeat protein